MTATSTELMHTSGRGLLAAVRSSLSRDEFFAGLYIVGCAGALGSNIIRLLTSGDWAGAIASIENISVIVWFACFAGISLMLRDKNDAIKSTDLLVAIVFLALIAAPASEVNWAAVTGLSLYILLFTGGTSARRRGAIILLALTVPMLWSRVLFSFFAKFFLEIDAHFVGWLLRTPRTGNVLSFADGSGSMVILPACSSLANVSLAFLFWVTISQWLDHRRSYEDILWCLLACASVVAANVTRMAIMGLGRWHFETFHYGWGATLVNAIILCLIVGFCILGVRRELFPRT